VFADNWGEEMSILVDWQINDRLKLTPPLATHVTVDEFRNENSKIKAATLDLTIGGIYLPGTENCKPGGVYAPLAEHTLSQGRTAVIKTKEVLNLSADLAAVAFPPAGLSLKGLLMTNPGHIDPGYAGPLHLTVINMSHTPFPLSTSDRIIRVVFIKLDKEPKSTYADRHTSSAGAANYRNR
jgi:deoxycytidine triphosphate deaminase